MDFSDDEYNQFGFDQGFDNPIQHGEEEFMGQEFQSVAPQGHQNQHPHHDHSHQQPPHTPQLVNFQEVEEEERPPSSRRPSIPQSARLFPMSSSQITPEGGFRRENNPSDVQVLPGSQVRSMLNQSRIAPEGGMNFDQQQEVLKIERF